MGGITTFGYSSHPLGPAWGSLRNSWVLWKIWETPVPTDESTLSAEMPTLLGLPPFPRPHPTPLIVGE
jgi:hypothetical protein